MSNLDRRVLLEDLLPVARRAGKAILEIYATDFAVRNKGDASPVTEADERAEALILPALAALTPEIPVVSEEAVAAGQIPSVSDRFWLVDPLDGTKEFIQCNGEFTVNIALIEKRRAVLGVVLAPALDRLYAGASATGAFLETQGNRQTIACRVQPGAGITVVASRSHNDVNAMAGFLKGRRVASLAEAGSSLKFCLVAAGLADLYPRLGRTMEWDTAAGNAVLHAAGGKVTTLDGAELAYGKDQFANPHFLASGRD